MATDSEILANWCFAPFLPRVTLEAAAFSHLQELPVECACGAVGWQVGVGEDCQTCGGMARKRQLSVCRDCGDDMLKSATARRSDYAVDPLFIQRTAGGVRCVEPWEQEIWESIPAPQPGQILGRPIWDFAPAVFALSDFEEMILARVHPLVQVYSIPLTGELGTWVMSATLSRG